MRCEGRTTDELEWKARYMAYLLRIGMSGESAEATLRVAEVDFSVDPEHCAEDDLAARDSRYGFDITDPVLTKNGTPDHEYYRIADEVFRIMEEPSGPLP